MASHLTPALRAEGTFSVPVKSDRFAQTDGRSQRTQPLMRKFEIASLLPCGSTRTSHHLAPSTELFEATSTAFARGTLINAPGGPIAVEDLIPGDRIETVDGRICPVVWIGSTTYVPAQTAPATTLTRLIRLLDGGFGAHTNLGDLMLGPAARLVQRRSALEHSIGVSAVLTPIHDFEDGHTAVEITPPSPVRLFHLRLPAHAAIYAGGRPVETYHPGKLDVDAMGENMRSLFLSLFPDVETFDDFGPLNYPRMSRETLESLMRY
ncbi:MAG: Hint domain-containing protein [Pseudomonadota bacterium]